MYVRTYVANNIPIDSQVKIYPARGRRLVF